MGITVRQGIGFVNECVQCTNPCDVGEFAQVCLEGGVPKRTLIKFLIDLASAQDTEISPYLKYDRTAEYEQIFDKHADKIASARGVPFDLDTVHDVGAAIAQCAGLHL